VLSKRYNREYGIEVHFEYRMKDFRLQYVLEHMEKIIPTLLPAMKGQFVANAVMIGRRIPVNERSDHPQLLDSSYPIYILDDNSSESIMRSLVPISLWKDASKLIEEQPQHPFYKVLT